MHHSLRMVWNALHVRPVHVRGVQSLWPMLWRVSRRSRSVVGDEVSPSVVSKARVCVVRAHLRLLQQPQRGTGVDVRVLYCDGRVCVDVCVVALRPAKALVIYSIVPSQRFVRTFQ